MADIEQLKAALRNADAAGDTEAASKLAAAIVRMQQDTPKPNPDGTYGEVPPGFVLDESTGQMVDTQAYNAAKNQALQNMPWYDLRRIGSNVDDIGRLMGSGTTYGGADKLMGAVGPYGEDIERAKTQAARERQGAAGTAAELAGNVLGAATLASRGGTLMGRFGTAAMPGAKGLGARSLLAVGEGAGYGGAQSLLSNSDILGDIPEAVKQAAISGVYGGIGGGLGNMAGEGLAKLGQGIGRAYSHWKAGPAKRAEQEVFDAVQMAGGPDAVASRMKDLGPDAMQVDALGTRGAAIGRKYANLSPEAREALAEALDARKAGQNARVVEDIQKLSGLPAGARDSVDDLKIAALEKVQPDIDAAYEAAKVAGFDLDPKEFDDILSTPSGARAWKESLKAVRDRAALNPMKSPIGETPSSVPMREAVDRAKSTLRRENKILNRVAPAPSKDGKPVSLTEFLARKGGVKDFKGELTKGLGLDKKFKKAGKPLLNESGLDLDYAREAAAEAGYFDHIYGDFETAIQKSTVADLLDAIDNDVRFGNVFSGEDAARAEYDDMLRGARDMFRQHLDDVSAEGIDNVSDDVVERAVENLANEGTTPADALQKAIADDIAENGIAPQSVKPGMFDKEKVRDFSNLARLDAAKRRLDANARSAAISGDNDVASRNSALAKALRERMDEALQDDVYANARALRQDAYRTDEAFDMGAELAKGLDTSLPKKAADIAKKEAMAQGYGAQMTNTLLRKNDTPGAITALRRNSAIEAAEAALGPEKAKALGDALLRERLFNKTYSDIMQNSTTARQLAEMAGGGGIGGIYGLISGEDPMASAAYGAAAGAAAGGVPGMARRVGPTIAKAITTNATKAQAPSVAKSLIGRNVMSKAPIPPNLLERLSASEREALARALTVMGAGTGAGFAARD